MFSVADTLDALTTDRPYRARLSLDARRGDPRVAGTQFDPDVVAAFEPIPDEEFEPLWAACYDLTTLIVDDDPMIRERS